MLNATPPTAQQLSDFTRATGFVIPASARPIRFYAVSGLDDVMYLQFQLPATDYEHFLASSPIPKTEVLAGDQGAELALAHFRRWVPRNPKNFRYTDTQVGPGRYVKCIFDFDDPKTTIIYLMWFTT